jgi:V/A-type H+/Na+-transporting ATPase subunit K
MIDIGRIGLAGALCFAAIGSASGIGIAGMAAVGAWKRCYAQNKTAPFLLLVFIGAPLTQTIYGFLLMLTLQGADVDAMAKLSIGVLGGIAMGFSALFQGKVGANASDALGETGKGFVNFIIALGLVETIALFVMVFFIMLLQSL